MYKALDTLRKENQFNELKIVSVDQLMYVKEDIILPHHYTFYDLIVTKARGKSGPLFMFDCRDDIRIVNDASKEKEESHAGKVVLRSMLILICLIIYSYQLVFNFLKIHRLV